MDSLYDVLSEPAGQADSPSPEVLAEQGFSTTAVETLIALKGQGVSACVDRLAVIPAARTVMPTSATQRSPLEKPSTSLPISTATPTAS